MPEAQTAMATIPIVINQDTNAPSQDVITRGTTILTEMGRLVTVTATLWIEVQAQGVPTCKIDSLKLLEFDPGDDSFGPGETELFLTHGDNPHDERVPFEKSQTSHDSVAGKLYQINTYEWRFRLQGFSTSSRDRSCALSIKVSPLSGFPDSSRVRFFVQADFRTTRD